MTWCSPAPGAPQAVSRRRETGRVARHRLGRRGSAGAGPPCAPGGQRRVRSRGGRPPAGRGARRLRASRHHREQRGRGPRRGPGTRDRPDVDLWPTVIDVNLNDTLYMSRAFGRALAEQGDGGGIVNVFSDAGKMMSARAAAYSASPSVHALTSRWHLSSVGSACASTRYVRHRRYVRLTTFRAASDGTTSWRACRWDAPVRRGHRLDDRLPVWTGLLDHRPALRSRTGPSPAAEPAHSADNDLRIAPVASPYAVFDMPAICSGS